ncbi:MAG TPA: PQQ-dependent sugar dehydrogenase [Casimicrobiaceae bacterium]|nr:PQQ-dependent sugar dehydrogenase [Casimicrobiaceae bacterium]
MPLRPLLAALATLGTLACCSVAFAGHSLRFGGTGSGDVDRVKIRVDDPANSLPGPRIDVGANDFTIELWIKGTLADNTAPALPCGTGGTTWINGNVVLDRDRRNQDRNFGLSFANGRAVFGVSGASTGDRTLCGSSNVLDGAWHHVAAQRRRSDGFLWLYVDGTLEAQVDGPDGDISYPDDGVPGNFCGGPCTNSDPFLVIGAAKHDLGPSSPSFNGYVDELRISTTLRYPASSFSRPRAPFVPDAATAALYHFDEGLGATLFDVMPKATGSTDGSIRRASPTAFPHWSTDTPFNALQTIGSSTIALNAAISGLSAPVDVVSPPDASGALYIVQQGGLVRVVRNGAALPTPFLDVTSKISVGSERGLLSLVFHPDYLRNGRLFVYYTRTGDGALTIERYTRSANNANTVNPTSAVTLLSIPHSAGNHNGGRLAFGPDGYLYVGTGDSGGANDPANAAQNISTRLGKMLRLDVDVDNAPFYAIPPTNPFAGQSCDGVSTGTCPEIWSYGLRNPWRYSFDRLTGDLFIGDVGQGAREEVDFQSATSAGGTNYGWRVLEGSICTPGVNPSCTPPVNAVPPILEYDRGAGQSITGGFRYRGSRIPALAGAYLYSDYLSRALWAATTNGTGAWMGQQLLLTAPTGIASFGEDSNAELYAAGVANGTIYRINPLDSDADGLPDWWETAYFGSTTAAIAAADSDSDGFSNLAEYSAGTDPMLATSRPIRIDAPRDFDASGSADLLWNNTVTGEQALWTLNGIAPIAATILPAPAPWHVTHAADLDGDRRHDLVWRNTSTGETAAWLMSGAQLSAAAILLSNAAWRVTHTGDFDGDGRGDLVWRNDTTGGTSLWLMNALTPTNAVTVLVRPDWRVTHVGDLNGDGRSDLVWRNDSTGETALWTMNGTQCINCAVVLTRPDWAVVLVADFDGDGRSDLVWRNASTGEVALWLMNGIAFNSVGIVLSNSSWTPTHATDLDGDGRADLVWRNTTTGETHAWLMDGRTLRQWGAISVAGSSVVATGDFDGDGRSDLVWNDPSAGITRLFTMDGLTTITGTVLVHATAWDVRP